MKTLPNLYYHLTALGNIETTTEKLPEAMAALKGYLLVNECSYQKVAKYREDKFSEKQQTIDSLNALFKK